MIYFHPRHRSHCEQTWIANQHDLCPETGQHHACHRRKKHRGHDICYCGDIDRHPNRQDG